MNTANGMMGMGMGMPSAMGMNMGGMMMPQLFTFQPTWTSTNGVTHLNVTTVGAKTEQRAIGIQMLTILLGACLIFPLFFTCCMWWKKLVYPKYEVNEEAYRAVGRFCKRSPNCSVINLTVCDNGLNAEKANILYDGLIGSRVSTFNLTNMALDCNYRQNEVDNFMTNVACLKDLGQTKTSLTWGDMTF